jgi:hypothetical protein
VKKENGRARRTAVLGIGEFSATFQPKHFALVHEIPLFSAIALRAKSSFLPKFAAVTFCT